MANITGARLREAERQLALLKGEAAVNEYLESHPNETKVLQQLVDWRRAGKPAPSLARVQRAMVWSDGTIELNTVAVPEPAPRPGPGRDGPNGRDRRYGRDGGRPAPGGGQRRASPAGTARSAPGRLGRGPREHGRDAPCRRGLGPDQGRRDAPSRAPRTITPQGSGRARLARGDEDTSAAGLQGGQQVVDRRGLEPRTSAMRMLRSPR